MKEKITIPLDNIEKFIPEETDFGYKN